MLMRLDTDDSIYTSWFFSQVLSPPACLSGLIAEEEEKGVYRNFLNFLMNDGIYLLDESLDKILELEEPEAEMANTVEWKQRPRSGEAGEGSIIHSTLRKTSALFYV